jgi:hypothetical protein
MAEGQELQAALDAAETDLKAAWQALKLWCQENTLGVSAQRAYMLDGVRSDAEWPAGHWSAWYGLSNEEGLRDEGRPFVAAVYEAALAADIAAEALHYATHYHVYYRTWFSLAGSYGGQVTQDPRGYDSLEQAVERLKDRIAAATSAHEPVLGFVYFGTEGGLDEDGFLHGEPLATVVASDATLQKNHGATSELTITGALQRPFVEV